MTEKTTAALARELGWERFRSGHWVKGEWEIVRSRMDGRWEWHVFDASGYRHGRHPTLKAAMLAAQKTR